jgi:hypothetical protein
MRQETFGTPGPVSLDVRLPAGRLQIETDDSSETRVELEPLRDNEATIAAVTEARVEMRERAAGGQHVTVHVPTDHRGFAVGGVRIGLSRSPEVLVRVRCPHGTSVDAEGGSADIEAHGRLGPAKVSTSSGDIELEDVDGEASVSAASGDVEIGRVNGRARVDTASGDVQIERIEGEGEVNSASGDTLVKYIGGTLRVNSASGDVVVREAAASVIVRTASGDQRLDSVQQGEISLESASGDISIGVRRGTKVWLDVRSRSGDTSSELDVGDDPPEEGAPSLELRASSMSGDVHVARAA